MAPEGTQLKRGREEQGPLAQAPDLGGTSKTVQTMGSSATLRPLYPFLRSSH